MSIVNSQLPSAAGLCFAVEAAVDLLLPVGEPEDVVQLLLGGGDAPGVLAEQHVGEGLGEGHLALLHQRAVADDVHGGTRVHVGHHVQIDGDVRVDLDNVLLAHLPAVDVPDDGHGEVGFVELQKVVECTDRKSNDDFYLRIDLQERSIVSTDANNVHIRKIPTHKYSWEYLKQAGMIDEPMIEYFRDRIVNGYGFLISGSGGSGKTSLLNKLIDWIPYNQSGLVSQESDELYSEVHPQMQFEHTMTFEKGEESKEYSLEEHLRLGLLQDIDNFIIGEIKGAEALYVFTTGLNTGARFMGTIHSNDAASSVTRLAQCARYKSDYPMETLEEMLTAVPFVLVHMSEFKVQEILEIEGYDHEYKRLMFHKVYKRKED